MIETSKGSLSPSRTTVMTISDPTGPRIRSTASSSVRPEHGLAVDMGDEVAGLDPGLVRGGAVDRRDDLDEALFLRDLDPEPAEFAAGLHAHVGGIVRRKVARMRVERGEHAVDGRLDQVGLVHLLDILRADTLEDVAEKVELLVDAGGLVLFLGE